jgi:hypothetical protein
MTAPRHRFRAPQSTAFGSSGFCCRIFAKNGSVTHIHEAMQDFTMLQTLVDPNGGKSYADS